MPSPVEVPWPELEDEPVEDEDVEAIVADRIEDRSEAQRWGD